MILAYTTGSQFLLLTLRLCCCCKIARISSCGTTFLTCLHPKDTREECLDRKIGSCGNSSAYSSKSIPSFKKAALKRGRLCIKVHMPGYVDKHSSAQFW